MANGPPGGPELSLPVEFARLPVETEPVRPGAADSTRGVNHALACHHGWSAHAAAWHGRLPGDVLERPFLGAKARRRRRPDGHAVGVGAAELQPIRSSEERE